MIETLIQVRQIGHRSVCHSTRHCVQLLQCRGNRHKQLGFGFAMTSRWITNSMNRSVRPVVACCCWIISVFIATYYNISSSIFNCLTKPNSHSMYYTYKILWASNHNVDNPASEVVLHQENTQLLLLLWLFIIMCIYITYILCIIMYYYSYDDAEEEDDDDDRETTMIMMTIYDDDIRWPWWTW